MQFDSAHLTLQAGALFHHGPNVQRSIQPEEGACLRLSHLAIGGDGAAKALFLALGTASPGHLEQVHPDAMLIWDQVIKQSMRQVQGVTSVVDALLACLLAMLAFHRQQKPQGHSATADVYQRCCRWIQENLTAPVDLARLARSVGVSPSYLCRAFKIHSGTGPVAWWRHRQMQAAQEWLCEEAIPIKEIAHKLGFSDDAAFNKAFKRATGRPPGDFKPSRNRGRTKQTEIKDASGKATGGKGL